VHGRQLARRPRRVKHHRIVALVGPCGGGRASVRISMTAREDMNGLNLEETDT
jgi:hypothetical protein